MTSRWSKVVMAVPVLGLLPGCLALSVKGPILTSQADVSARGAVAEHPPGPHGSACDVLEAAGKVTFSSDQREVLEKVARRQDLSAHEQVYLINVAFTMNFSRDQASVLTTLAENPALSSTGRSHLVERLEEIRFSSDRKRVVDALADNRAGPASGAGD